MTAIWTVALAATVGLGEAQAQLSIGAQFSVTNLGTDAAQVGETLGVGGRLGIHLWQGPSARVFVEAVGDFFFPPCDQLDCSLYGSQLNVLGMLDSSGSSRVYGGLGLTYQDYSLEDDSDGTSIEGNGTGMNLIIGIAWTAAPMFEPFFEIRLSAIQNMRRQSSGQIGFRIMPGA